VSVIQNSERLLSSADDDDAAPRARAVAIERGRSCGRSRAISRWETTACTTAESAKPRISGHRISHPMANAMLSARKIASIIDSPHQTMPEHKPTPDWL
jgi:hypothetical protein